MRKICFIAMLLTVVSSILNAQAVKVIFEAEEVLPRGELLIDSPQTAGWDLCTKDPVWSGGKVIRGSRVTTDSEPGRGGLPILRFYLLVPKDGVYKLYGKMSPDLSISVDGGKNWWRVSKHRWPKKSYKAGDTVEILVTNCRAATNKGRFVYIDKFTLYP